MHAVRPAHKHATLTLQRPQRLQQLHARDTAYRPLELGRCEYEMGGDGDDGVPSLKQLLLLLLLLLLPMLLHRRDRALLSCIEPNASLSVVC